MRRIVVASLVCLLAFPATAAAKPPNPTALKKEGVRVTWPVPATATKAVGDLVEVRVRSERRRVKVSLVVVGSDGRPRKAVARRTLRNGTFRATLAEPGTYALRLVVAKRRYASQLTVPAPPVPPPAPAPPMPPAPALPACLGARESGTSAALSLSPTTLRAGETLTIAVTNTSDGCLMWGLSYRIDRVLLDGSTETMNPNESFPAAGLLVAPGATRAKQIVLASDLPPGHYRLHDRVLGESPLQWGMIPLSAGFEIVAAAPE